jgi:hypothetical protein
LIGCPSSPRSRAAILAALLLSIAATVTSTSEAHAQRQTTAEARQLSVDTVRPGSVLAMHTSATIPSAASTALVRGEPRQHQSSITSSLTAAIKSCSGIGTTGSRAARPATIGRQQLRTAASAGSPARQRGRTDECTRVTKRSFPFVPPGAGQISGARAPQTVWAGQRAHPRKSTRGV